MNFCKLIITRNIVCRETKLSEKALASRWSANHNFLLHRNAAPQMRQVFGWFPPAETRNMSLTKAKTFKRGAAFSRVLSNSDPQLTPMAHETPGALVLWHLPSHSAPSPDGLSAPRRSPEVARSCPSLLVFHSERTVRPWAASHVDRLISLRSFTTTSQGKKLSGEHKVVLVQSWERNVGTQGKHQELM